MIRLSREPIDSTPSLNRNRTSSAIHSSVLVLNRSFVAVHVISTKRAFCLLCKDVAEVIHVEDGSFMNYDFTSWLEVSELKCQVEEPSPEDDWIQAVNFMIQVPRVIRLVGYDRFPTNSVKFSRRNVFLRDNNRCQYCGKTYHTKELSLDHVIPRSRGGKMTWENIVCACIRCNVKKGGRTPQEAGMALQQKPRKPIRSPLLADKLNSQKYAVWKKFVD